MHIIEVRDKKTIREFLKVPKIIYKDDPYWVCPLDQETESIFNKEENSFFSHGEAARWILEGENGAIVGRVAASLIRIKRSRSSNLPEGWDFLSALMIVNLLFCSSTLAATGLKKGEWKQWTAPLILVRMM